MVYKKLCFFFAWYQQPSWIPDAATSTGPIARYVLTMEQVVITLITLQVQTQSIIKLVYIRAVLLCFYLTACWNDDIKYTKLS